MQTGPASRTTTATRVAYALAGMRALAGLAFLTIPTRAARSWMGADDARRPGARMAVRGMGARDFAVSLGHLRALQGDGPAANWALAGAIADAGDCLATLAAARALPARRVVFGAGAAGAAAAAGAWLSTIEH